MPRLRLIVVACALVLAACTSGEPSGPAPVVSETRPPTTTPTPTSSTSSPAAALAEATVTWTVVGEGFDGPLQILSDPRNGATLVVEQVGRITALDGQVVADLTGRVTSGGERGLLGAAFAPDGSRLLVDYSGDEGATVLSSLPIRDGTIDTADETVLFTTPQPAANHNGGALLFDPDGALILSLGDGGGAGDQFGNGQNTDTPLGGLLRMDVTSQPGKAVPFAGNPFTGGSAPLLWVYGLRNPWRIAFDDTYLYVADVGQDTAEEVSVIPRGEATGANFGWPLLEGSVCYRSPDCDPSGTVPPTAQLRQSDGACSIIGGVIVPAGDPTGLGGAFLYSDLCDTQLRALRMGSDGADVAVVEGGTIPATPLGFGRGSDGQVWVGTADGRVLRLTAP